MIGTGASAIQFVPQIQPKRDRAAPLPAHGAVGHAALGPRLTKVEHLLFKHLPFTQRLARAGIYWAREAMVIGMAGEPRLLKGLQLLGQALHPPLDQGPASCASKVTPGYTIGCKRILISNDYLQSLDRPNVEVVGVGPRARCAATSSSAPTAPSARSTRSSSGPAST